MYELALDTVWINREAGLTTHYHLSQLSLAAAAAVVVAVAVAELHNLGTPNVPPCNAAAEKAPARDTRFSMATLLLTMQYTV